MIKKLSMMDVKQALLDSRFRETLPESLLSDVQKFLNNPGCSCNHPIYRKIMKEAKDQLTTYFPLKEQSSEEIVEEKISKNEWTVINCTIHELQSKLKSLRPGPMQLQIARFEDQVTVVVNHLE